MAAGQGFNGFFMARQLLPRLGRGKEHRVVDVAKARGAETAPLLTQARIKFLTLNLDFSIDKAKRVLGYEPRVDFQEGIHKALDWLAQQGRLAPPRCGGL